MLYLCHTNNGFKVFGQRPPENGNAKLYARDRC
nr:MAG TPA: hypothetical protein [Caudoviricetes sp.]